MHDDDRESSYYRAVEDFFAVARGCPHTLSPKDVQLLRGWWRDGVPLQAVTTAISEVFARRRERGDDEAAVSLRYCRHAVKREVKRLAALRAGASTQVAVADAAQTRSALDALAARLHAAAQALPEELCAAAAVIRHSAERLADLNDLPPTELDEQLFNLDSHLMAACTDALPATVRQTLMETAEAAASASGARGAARERSRRAMADRELRILLALPRLELP